MGIRVRFLIFAAVLAPIGVFAVLAGCDVPDPVGASGVNAGPLARPVRASVRFGMRMGAEDCIGTRGQTAVQGGVQLENGTVTPGGDNVSGDVKVKNVSVGYTMGDVQVRVVSITPSNITTNDSTWNYGDVGSGSDSISKTWVFTRSGGPGSFSFTVVVSWWCAEVSTLAGTGISGSGDGAASTAQFNNPRGAAVETAGGVYVADTDNHCIRLISGGTVSTFAGSRTPGLQDGGASTARFSSPMDVAVDDSGNVYVADSGNHRIRKVSGGQVTTIAGIGSGFADGRGDTTAKFKYPDGLALDTSQGVLNVFVADRANHRIRRVYWHPGGYWQVVTSAGSTSSGYLDTSPATQAKFNQPRDVVADAAGDVYVADELNHRIRKIPASGANVTTLAGSGPTGSGNGGFADGAATTEARFNGPFGVAVDSQGNVYVADTGNHRIRKILGGQVSTFAGTGTAAFLDGLASVAQFNGPSGVAVDSAGNVYVADRYNHRIRKIAPQ